MTKEEPRRRWKSMMVKEQPKWKWGVHKWKWGFQKWKSRQEPTKDGSVEVLRRAL